MTEEKKELSPEEKEFSQHVLALDRVTRVTAGGKRMRFRAAVIVGDGKGRVGFGLGKALDVTLAVSKATRRARKNLIEIPIVKGTIPCEVRRKFGAAFILMKPAVQGSGIKAGGAMRIIFELGGVSNVLGKILGSKNKINNAKATIAALCELKLIKR